MTFVVTAGESGFEAPTTADFWQPWFGTGQFAVTRSSVVVLLSVALIVWWLLHSTKQMSLVPSRKQMVTEEIYGVVRNGLAREIIGSHDFLRFVPLLFSVFVLILVNNLFGVIPPVQFPTMSRIGFPVAMTLLVYLAYHGAGIKKQGLGPYLGHMIPKGIPAWTLVLVVPLEFLTYFVTRPVTLALRLWGNMFAGHLLLVLFITGGEYLVIHSGNAGYAVGGILSWVMAMIMTVFELLVEVLQAYVFTLLAALYIAGSVAQEHEHEAH